MNEIIWQDRLCYFADGLFWLSRKGNRKDFNVEAIDTDAAFSGSCGLGKVTGLAVLDNQRLKIETSAGTFVLSVQEDGEFRIDPHSVEEKP